jgi:hypothetical protein
VDKYIRSTPDGAEVAIRSCDYWIKVVGMLQQNWALIDDEREACTVYFLDDVGGVFDRISFASVAEAESGLDRNRFTRFSLFCVEMSAEQNERYATALAEWNWRPPGRQRDRSKPEQPTPPDLIFAAPKPPFRLSEHPNGFIYSSGRYWQ